MFNCHRIWEWFGYFVYLSYGYLSWLSFFMFAFSCKTHTSHVHGLAQSLLFAFIGNLYALHHTRDTCKNPRCNPRTYHSPVFVNITPDGNAYHHYFCPIWKNQCRHNMSPYTRDRWCHLESDEASLQIKRLSTIRRFDSFDVFRHFNDVFQRRCCRPTLDDAENALPVSLPCR